MIPRPVSTAPPLSLREGQKLAGCYLLKRRIGGPSEAAVWAAHDEVLDKEVSLHFLPAAVPRDAIALAALRQEVKRSRALIHPHVLRVYDLIEEADWAAISMDVFEARSLEAVVQEASAIEPADIEPWLAVLGQTLEEAHRHHFIHGDLSAQNVFVDGPRGVFVAGFGFSRLIQDSLHRAEETSHRAHLSTQLLAGQKPTGSDDIYALGALLFYALTGESVFAEDEPAEQICDEVPRRVSEVWRVQGKAKVLPARWDETIAACLSKAAESRPASPAQLLAKLAGSESPPSAALPWASGPSEAEESTGPKRKASELLAERAAQYRAEGARPSIPAGPNHAVGVGDQRAVARVEVVMPSAANRGAGPFIPPRPARRPVVAIVAIVVVVVGLAAFAYHRIASGRAADRSSLMTPALHDGASAASTPSPLLPVAPENVKEPVEQIVAPPEIAPVGVKNPPETPGVELVPESVQPGKP